MAWFKVDDGFASCRQILAIPRRYRCAAAGLWTLAGTWSAKELTDGFIPDYVVIELGGTHAMAAWLVKVGLWEKTSSGYQVRNWNTFQFTKEQVLKRRTEESERKKRAREAKAKRSDQQNVDNVRSVSHADTLNVSARRPLYQTRPDQTRTHLSLLTLGGEVALVDAHDPPPSRCPAHIDDPAPPPCRACGDARRTHDAWTAQSDSRKRELAAQRRSLIDACTLCDDQGMVDLGNGAARCDHLDMAEPF